MTESGPAWQGLPPSLAFDNPTIAFKSGNAPKFLASVWKGSDSRNSIGYGPRTKKVPRHQYSRSKSWEDFIKRRCQRLNDERVIATVLSKASALLFSFLVLR